MFRLNLSLAMLASAGIVFLITTSATAQYEDVVLADNPIVYYRLGDTDGTATNLGSLATNGTYNGARTQRVTGLINDPDDTAVDFNGGYVAGGIGGAIDGFTGDMTFEAWVKMENPPGDGQAANIFSRDANQPRIWKMGTFTAAACGAAQPTCYYSEFFNAGGGGLVFHEAAPTGEADHFVVVYDRTGGKRQFWLNGAQVGDDIPVSADLNQDAGKDLHIGVRFPGRESFDGIIDEAAIYDTAFTPAQIEAHFQAGNTGPPTSLVRTWNKNGTGDWNVGGNWVPAVVPDTLNNTAVFSDATSAPTTVVADTPITVGAIEFDHDITYAIAGTGGVSLEANSLPGSPWIRADQGAHEFQTRVQLLDDTTVNVATDAVLEFDNDLLLNGNTLTKSGFGTVSINNVLNAGGGTVNCQQGTCGGVGTIGGDLNNVGGTVSPGNSPGALAAVPEPGSAVLIGLGLMVLGWFSWGRSKGSKGPDACGRRGLLFSSGGHCLPQADRRPLGFAVTSYLWQ